MSQTLPPQHQTQQPGREADMHPRPAYRGQHYRPAGKLEGKVALISGGDSGIGRAVALHFAREGADVAIVYLEEGDDASQVAAEVTELGRTCLCLQGDLAVEAFCEQVVALTLERFGRLDILVNNAAEQHPRERLEDIELAQWRRTFESNVQAMYLLTRAALEHMGEGASIVNTTSVTAYRGSGHLIDYSATKGAILAFTRSLSQNLAGRGIRVNAVAPGPIWTPLIPSTFSADEVAEFGANTALGRPGQPEEVAPAYVYLASQDASYVTGQVIHVNGGSVING